MQLSDLHVAQLLRAGPVLAEVSPPGRYAGGARAGEHGRVLRETRLLHVAVDVEGSAQPDQRDVVPEEDVVVVGVDVDLGHVSALLPGRLALPPHHARPHAVEVRLVVVVVAALEAVDAVRRGDDPVRGHDRAAADEAAVPADGHGGGPAAGHRHLAPHDPGRVRGVTLALLLRAQLRVVALVAVLEELLGLAPGELLAGVHGGLLLPAPGAVVVRPPRSPVLGGAGLGPAVHGDQRPVRRHLVRGQHEVGAAAGAQHRHRVAGRGRRRGQVQARHAGPHSAARSLGPGDQRPRRQPLVPLHRQREEGLHRLVPHGQEAECGGRVPVEAVEAGGEDEAVLLVPAVAAVPRPVTHAPRRHALRRPEHRARAEEGGVLGAAAVGLVRGPGAVHVAVALLVLDEPLHAAALGLVAVVLAVHHHVAVLRHGVARQPVPAPPLPPGVAVHLLRGIVLEGGSNRSCPAPRASLLLAILLSLLTDGLQHSCNLRLPRSRSPHLHNQRAKNVYNLFVVSVVYLILMRL